MVTSKYAASFLSLLVLLLGGIASTLTAGVTKVSIAQLVILFLGGIGTFIVPLAKKGAWAGVFKTGIAILAAIVTALIPFLTPGHHITNAETLVVVAGAIQAAATQLGTAIRLDAPAPSDKLAREVLVAQGRPFSG